ncbi:TonB-dependent receptor [Alteromonas gilva]|uniref:TonB-dependent receptor n=1 Tax=Alteromonas gilva TaxID=2987522 RepID=A0ABT5KZQ6_9ALTE|nr:TonB-dependent receptor [Alteromonas gilva]MDC8830251.1 TonB-dependent receptor [Alteromonas gilva]
MKEFRLTKISCTIAFLLAVNSSLAAAQEEQAVEDKATNKDKTLEVIMVTSQHRQQSLAEVPVSITALSGAELDKVGARKVDDIFARTPGVNFSRTNSSNTQRSSISIRGISSSAGSSTTGIYIDDTPIQSRSLGYSSFNSFPKIFDLDRVEVLRGPQGTLFGAGSMGGTVRFIAPTPDLYDDTTYLRTELAHTEDGEMSQEFGFAYGAPIIEGKLAYRLSLWQREDGGWIDRVNWQRAADPSAALPVAGDTIDENANSEKSRTGRLAITYKPTDALTITPSVFYQKAKLNDTSAYWQALSDPDEGEYRSGNAISSPSEDEFTLSALKVEWELSGMSILSNTSYFDRDAYALNDYTAFEQGLWAGNPFFPEGVEATAEQINAQKNWTQELRIQSTGMSDLNWVVGAFYSKLEQESKQFVTDQYIPDFLFGIILGPLDQGRYTSVIDPAFSNEEQLSVFAQVDYDVTEKLTLTAGLRVADTEVEAGGHYRGAVVGAPVTDEGSQSETPVTPKLGIKYTIDEDNMIYGSASKGYRIGGYNSKVGAPCAGDFANLGLEDRPPLYKSDSLWNYEVGSKNSFNDGAVRLSSSAFYIDWKDIQQSVNLQSCGFTFVANQGSAKSYGFDLALEAMLTEDLIVNMALGYTNAEFQENVIGGPAAMFNIVSKGDHVVGNPWTGTISAEYFFTLLDKYDAFARLDYNFKSKQTDMVAGNNPANGAQPNNFFEQPATNLLSIRTGVTINDYNISLFVNNLFNSNTVTSLTASPTVEWSSILLGTPPINAQSLYTSTTLRPRTYGVTLSYRY